MAIKTSTSNSIAFLATVAALATVVLRSLVVIQARSLSIIYSTPTDATGLPSKTPMAGHTTSLTTRSTAISGTLSTWQEVTPSQLPTTLSTRTARPPDQPAGDLVLEERVQTIRNLWGLSYETILSAAMHLARSTDRFWITRMREISRPKELRVRVSVHFQAASCRPISSQTSTGPIIYPIQRTMILPFGKIRLLSMSGWTHGRLGSIRLLIRSSRPTLRWKGFVRRMGMRIDWRLSTRARSSFPTHHRLPMLVPIELYLEVSLLLSTGVKAVIPTERR